VDCAYFDTGACHSCTTIAMPISLQRATKFERARAAVSVAERERPAAWLPLFGGGETDFRNKAKMVVGGTVDAPTLGILDRELRGVDLRECRILLPGLREVQPALAAFIALARLVPYDVGARRGELKHVITTESPDGELMVRFVLRSTEALPRLRKHLPVLLREAPRIRVVTANIHPTHAAVLEGAEEIVLTEEAALPMRVNDLELRLPPRSFFQTNTEVAAALYRQARDWADRTLGASPRIALASAGETREPGARLPLTPASHRDRKRIVDLYCGVGGFGLSLAGEGREIIGVEASEDAIEAARATAQSNRIEATFEAGDAREWLPAPEEAAGGKTAAPDLVIVNPPRRGLGAELSTTLERSGVPALLYSSCNPETLARDLALMPSYRAVEARCFDMFPQTEHLEVMVLLERRLAA